MRIIDFDEIDAWGPWFGSALAGAASGLRAKLVALQPEFIEDAGDIVVGEIGRAEIVELVTAGLIDCGVRLYHGTRLSDEGIDSVRRRGLLPLNLAERRAELEDIFSRHPRWQVVRKSLSSVLDDIGPGEAAGRRADDRVHVCFSKAGLLSGCSHYLCYGAEVDGHIAHMLFGDYSAHQLLRDARKARLVTFVRPFAETCLAANPYGVREDELPVLVRLLLNCWAFREANPDWSPARLKEDGAAWFLGPVPASDVERIIDVPDGDLYWEDQ